MIDTGERTVGLCIVSYWTILSILKSEGFFFICLRMKILSNKDAQTQESEKKKEKPKNNLV